MAESTNLQARGNGGRRQPRARHLAVSVTGVLIAIGAMAALAPDVAIALSRHLVSPLGIYSAAALRCAVGIALLLIAHGSRAPAILRIMGVTVLAAGLTFPILGVEDSKARIEWEAGHMTFLRLEGVVFMWSGYLVYKLSKPREAELTVAPSNNSMERTRE